MLASLRDHTRHPELLKILFACDMHLYKTRTDSTQTRELTQLKLISDAQTYIRRHPRSDSTQTYKRRELTQTKLKLGAVCVAAVETLQNEKVFARMLPRDRKPAPPPPKNIVPPPPAVPERARI